MKKILTAVLACLILLLSGCAVPEKQAQVVTYEYFDTITTVKAAGIDEKELSHIIRETLGPLHAVFDIHSPHEDVCGAYELNNSSGKWISPHPELMKIVSLCREWNEKISPAADITMGALYEEWHNFRENGVFPAQAALIKAASAGGWENIETDGDRIRLLSPDTSLDFGAVAKGYAAARLAQALEDFGCTDYTISAGGNVVCGYRENPYRIGIQSPDSDDYSAILSLKNMCAVTSGDYQRFREYDGEKYHHIIDTQTLYPARTGIRQVTVICKDSAFADFMSTALFLIPVADGLTLAETAGVEAIWILDDGSMTATPDAEKYIESK